MVGLSRAEKFHDNFGTVRDGEDATGSILDMTRWPATVDDAWLIAGIHAKLPFHAASPLTRENLLEEPHVMTVTGRELLGMSVFGYEVRRGHPALEMVMLCADPALARSASMTKLQEHVDGCKTHSDVLKHYTQAGLNPA